MSLMIRKSYTDVVDKSEVDDDILDEVWKMNKRYLAARFPDYYREKRIAELILGRSNDSYTTMCERANEEMRIFWEVKKDLMLEYQTRTPPRIASLIEAMEKL